MLSAKSCTLGARGQVPHLTWSTQGGRGTQLGPTCLPMWGFHCSLTAPSRLAIHRRVAGYHLILHNMDRWMGSSTWVSWTTTSCACRASLSTALARFSPEITREAFEGIVLDNFHHQHLHHHHHHFLTRTVINKHKPPVSIFSNTILSLIW